MFARTITIDARPEAIDAGIAHVRDEIFDTVTGMAGCVGMSLVVDRDSGRCIATTAWESEDAMTASMAPLGAIRERAAQIFAGDLSIDQWEVAVMHRAHPAPEGACVRATWIKGDVAQMDRSIDVFKLATVPAIEMLEGFCSVSLMVDKSSGRAISTVTYDSRAALERTREAANKVRAEGTAESATAVQDVREFDLVLAHLHVPEMA